MTLRDFALQIETCANKAHAIELLQKNNFDGVLFDYMLEDGNGLEIINIAQNLYPKIPSILMTGILDSDSLKKTASSTKINKVIFKPFSIKELRQTIEQLLQIS